MGLHGLRQRAGLQSPTDLQRGLRLDGAEAAGRWLEPGTETFVSLLFHVGEWLLTENSVL